VSPFTLGADDLILSFGKRSRRPLGVSAVGKSSTLTPSSTPSPNVSKTVSSARKSMTVWDRQAGTTFLVDSGADESVYPATKADRQRPRSAPAPSSGFLRSLQESMRKVGIQPLFFIPCLTPKFHLPWPQPLMSMFGMTRSVHRCSGHMMVHTGFWMPVKRLFLLTKMASHTVCLSIASSQQPCGLLRQLHLVHLPQHRQRRCRRLPRVQLLR